MRKSATVSVSSLWNVITVNRNIVTTPIHVHQHGFFAVRYVKHGSNDRRLLLKPAFNVWKTTNFMMFWNGLRSSTTWMRLDQNKAKWQEPGTKHTLPQMAITEGTGTHQPCDEKAIILRYSKVVPNVIKLTWSAPLSIYFPRCITFSWMVYFIRNLI